MKITYPENKKVSFPVAVFLSTLLTVPVLSSYGGGSRATASSPPVDDTVGRTVSNNVPVDQIETRKGLSNGQKVALLAGAAALYYLYNRHKNAQREGAQGKYYLSKNGRVYYRDNKGQAHWVTPPSGGIQVPASEAQQYRDFQGYNGRTSGRTLSDVAR